MNYFIKKQSVFILFLVCVSASWSFFSTPSEGQQPKKYNVLFIHPSNVSVTQSLDAVVQSWHKALTANKVLIDYGKAIVRDLCHRDLTSNCATVDEIRAVIWYLFSESVQTGHGFSEGTWVIFGRKDDIKKVSAFFMSATDPRGFVATIKNSIIWDKKRRLSSHFKEWKSKHYGIDIKGLPISKKHVLFSSPVNLNNDDTEQKMYIKIENYGVSTLSDFVFHTKEYIGLEDRRERYFRKEKLPDHIKKLWLRHAPTIGLSFHDIQQGLHYGVGSMKRLLATVSKTKSIPAQLQDAIASYHPYAKGNEVMVELVHKIL